MSDILSSLVLEIDNEIISYCPNTLKYKDGRGEYAVFTESLGDGTVNTLFSEDDENKISSVIFEIYTTSDNVALKDTWKENTTGLSVTVSDSRTGYARSYTKMIMTNDPEISVAQDGKIEIELQGSPAA